MKELKNKQAILAQHFPFQVNFDHDKIEVFRSYAQSLRQSGICAEAYDCGLQYRIIVWGETYHPCANIGCEYRLVDTLAFCSCFE